MKLGVYLSCVLRRGQLFTYLQVRMHEPPQKLIKQNKRTVAMYTHVH